MAEQTIRDHERATDEDTMLLKPWDSTSGITATGPNYAALKAKHPKLAVWFKDSTSKSAWAMRSSIAETGDITPEQLRRCDHLAVAMKGPTPGQHAASLALFAAEAAERAAAAKEAAQASAIRVPFSDRGFTARTINRLVDAGIDAPERLLFMSPAEVKAIRGIGRAPLAEIAAYRSRFVDNSGALSKPR